MIKCKDFLTGGVKSDNPARKLGKILSRLLMLSLLVSSCTDDDVTGSGNVPLQVSVTANSPLVSRAIVTDDYLPDGSTIGVSLFAADGSSYDGQNYSNVKFTAAGTGDAQVWTGAAAVSLSGNPATVVAYYPWQEGANLTAIPVETASQTDYMWAETLTGVANTNPGVELVMNHALTAVRVKLVLGDYTGSVDVSNISVASPALGTAASLDVLGGEGALADITGQGDAVALDVDFDMAAEGTNTDVMLVPDESVTSGKTVVAATIGGKKFTAGIPFDEAYKQGYVYTYTITLNNKGFEVTKVAVTPWQDGGLKEAEFEPEKDDTYVVKIVASYSSDAGAESLGSRGVETFLFEHNLGGFVGTIDWGDGITTTYDVPTDWPSHEYPNDGLEYIITAKGSWLALNTYYFSAFSQCIREVIHIGDCGIDNMYVDDAFLGCINLTSIPVDLFKNCTKTESFTSVFEGCNALTNIPEGLFDNCTKVTDFEGTFAYCSGLQTIPEGLFDHCTEVTSFSNTFAYCSKLQTIPGGLFDHCIEVTNFTSTFYWCTALTVIPTGLFDNNTKVTSFGGTNGVMASSWGGAKTPNGVFCKCINLTSIPADLFKYNTKVVDMGGAFGYCTSLQIVPENIFKYNTEVVDMSGVFGSCEALTNIPVGIFDTNTKVLYFDYALAACWNLTGESPYTTINIDGVNIKVHLYERANYPEDFATPVFSESYNHCFMSNENLTDYADIPYKWK